MDLLGKHILIKNEWYDEYRKHDAIWTSLRRINRETKSQLISDTQRTPIDWSAKPLIWKHFQVTARRFKKAKLFLPNGDFTDYYGKTTLIENDISPMISDTPFDEMFKVVNGRTRKTLWEYESNKRNGFLSLFREFKTIPLCCNDIETYVGKYLTETFGLPAFYVDRIWFDDIKEHYFPNQLTTCKYDRNMVFYQVTNSGDDLELISNEDNKKNESVLMWVFKDKIVYKTSDGRGAW